MGLTVFTRRKYLLDFKGNKLPAFAQGMERVAHLFVYSSCVGSLCTPCVSCASPYAYIILLLQSSSTLHNSVYSLIIPDGCISSLPPLVYPWFPCQCYPCILKLSVNSPSVCSSVTTSAPSCIFSCALYRSLALLSVPVYVTLWVM